MGPPARGETACLRPRLVPGSNRGAGQRSVGDAAGPVARPDFKSVTSPWRPRCGIGSPWASDSIHRPLSGELVPNALFAALCVLVWPNTEAGLEQGQILHARAKALISDLDAGVPAYRLVRRYTPFLLPNQDDVARFLPLLATRGSVHSGLSAIPPPSARRPCLLARPMSTWRVGKGTRGHVTGVDPQITFTLSRSRPVAGIRINYAHTNRQGAPGRFQLSWKHHGQHDYTYDQRYANWNLPTGEGKETTVWIDDDVEQFRIQPDNQPCEFRIDKITLLEP